MSIVGGAQRMLELVQDSANDSEMTRAQEWGARYGMDPITLTSEFKANQVFRSDRRAELLLRKRFYASQQHDEKMFDFDGNLCTPGPFWFIRGSMGGIKNPQDISMTSRRPAMPYRLNRKIVQEFTDMLFGEGRFPTFEVADDPVTEDFVRALSEAGELDVAMTQARTLGGAVGTVGVSWAFHKGRPRIEAHSGENLFVHSWADEVRKEVGHVTEISQFYREQLVEGKIQRITYWYRFDWTETANVAFQPVEVDGSNDPEWIIDEDKSQIHNDGFAHFVWIQNLPTDDGTNQIDGEPDAPLLENFDGIDIVNSILYRGAKQNLDPTLVVKTDKDASQIVKGGDNSILPGASGSADYLEIAGTSITAGTMLLKEFKSQTMETAQCIGFDPDKVAAAGVSSVAMRLAHRPMLGKCSKMRTFYGTAMIRLITQMVESARERIGDGTEPVYHVETEGEGDLAQEIQVEYFLDLPPKVTKLEDNEGNEVIQLEPRKPGQGKLISLKWGDYFEKTDTDRQAESQALTAANGGRPLTSHKSSVEQYAISMGKDPEAEWKEVQAEMAAKTIAEDAELAAMTPTFGDQAGTDAELEAEPAPAEPEQTGFDDRTLKTVTELIEKVVKRTLPRESAIAVLVHGLRLDPVVAAELVGPAGGTFVPNPEPVM